MAACGLKCDECKIKDFCGYSVDTLGYDSFVELVENHDKEVINKFINKLQEIVSNIDILDDYMPKWKMREDLEKLKETYK